jgi:hypothetical protein
MMRLLMIILIVLLTACSSSGLSNKLVEHALALGVQQTQQQLNQQLNLGVQGYEIRHLRVQGREALTIQNLPAYRVQGTYDLALKLPSREVKQQKSFSVYLQRQKEGKTWRLLLPEGEGNKSWRSYAIN